MQNLQPTESSSLDLHMPSISRKHKLVSKINVHNLICDKCAVDEFIPPLVVYLSVLSWDMSSSLSGSILCHSSLQIISLQRTVSRSNCNITAQVKKETHTK